MGIGVGAALATHNRPARADKANDKIIMGIIGVGGRGRDTGRAFCQREDVEIKYACDADLKRIGDFPNQLERIQNKPVKAVQDMRVVFDDPEVDAVLITTCDHWHGLATIWACQAGKDVYVEKPASHNIWEGRKMVEAVEKYQRVVQVGMQNRSAPYVQAARDYIASGELGDVPLIKVFNMKGGGKFRMPENSDAPEGLDYKLWLGPAPSRPYNAAHCHAGWKKFWAYSGGDMADDGVHQLDIARMIMGDHPAPGAVNGSGGRIAFDDDREVPDTQVVSYEFENHVMTFELTQFGPYMHKTPPEVRDTDKLPNWPQNATRIEVYGTKGMMYLGRHGGGWQVLKENGKVVDQYYGRQTSAEHRANFLDCVRSRKTPNAHIEIGHQSASLVHLGNLAVRMGGARLEYDRTQEAITNNEQAQNNELRKRNYRDGFTVPEEV